MISVSNSKTGLQVELNRQRNDAGGKSEVVVTGVKRVDPIAPRECAIEFHDSRPDLIIPLEDYYIVKVTQKYPGPTATDDIVPEDIKPDTWE